VDEVSLVRAWPKTVVSVDTRLVDLGRRETLTSLADEEVLKTGCEGGLVVSTDDKSIGCVCDFVRGG